MGLQGKTYILHTFLCSAIFHKWILQSFLNDQIKLNAGITQDAKLYLMSAAHSLAPSFT